MIYIEEILILNKKEINRYIVDHKKHLIVIVEKLKSEMISLTTYIYRIEKRLKDLIQIKIAIDLKLLRDIKKFDNFEI